MHKTVPQVLSETIKNHGSKTAVCFKENGRWQQMTWNEYSQEMYQIAQAMCALGLKEKENVAILSQNCREWVSANCAAIIAGAVPCGIYPTCSAEQCEYILNHSQATVVVVGDHIQLEKILSIKEKLKSLKFIISIKKLAKPFDTVYSWQDMLAKSKEFTFAQLAERIQKQKPSDLATLVYTSGTTSNPKAVMLSHRNLTFAAEVNSEYEIKISADDVLISYLPLSHVAEQLTTIHGPLFSGACVWFAESVEKMAENLKDVRPTLFLGVPRVWEKIEAKMQEKSAQASPLKKAIARWARKVGLAAYKAEQQGKPKPFAFLIADKLVYQKVREALGLDRCRLQVTAAAPIAKETLEFFLSFNIPLYELYGMSECTGPAAISLPGNFCLGKTGKVMRGTEVKIADDGEILIRGEHVFQGYLHDEKATQEAIDSEGWLHSGDIGELDAQGFLAITGRKKNLIITAGGENIAPEMLENKLKTIPGIEQAVVIGDRKKHLGALLTLSPEHARMLCVELGSQAKTLEEISKCPKFAAYLKSELDKINQEVARVQTIKTFSVLPDEFSEESGDLTPTMKVKRGAVIKKYHTQIEALYN